MATPNIAPTAASTVVTDNNEPINKIFILSDVLKWQYAITITKVAISLHISNYLSHILTSIDFSVLPQSSSIFYK